MSCRRLLWRGCGREFRERDTFDAPIFRRVHHGLPIGGRNAVALAPGCRRRVLHPDISGELRQARPLRYDLLERHHAGIMHNA